MTDTVVNVQGFGKVRFPESMSPAEIEQAIERDILPKMEAQRSDARRQAFAESKDAPVNIANVVDVPRSFIRMLGYVSPAARVIDEISRPDVGRGVVDVGQGAKQLVKHLVGADDAKQYGKDVSREVEQYEADRGGDAAGFDWGRLAGNTGATSFLGLARAPATAGALLKYGMAAAQGGTAAALNPVDENKGDFATQKGIQTAIGAAVAPVAQFGIEKGLSFVGNQARKAGDFISTLYRKATGATPNANAVVDAQGNLTQAGEEAVRKLGIDWKSVGDDVKRGLIELSNDSTKASRSMTPEQQLRATMIREVTGEDATLGQVTRDFAQQQTEHDLKKVNSIGAPIRARFAKQNRGLIESIDDLTKKTGGTAVDEYEVGRRVASSIEGADKEAREAVSMLYREIDKEKGGQFAIKPQSVLDKLDDISDNAEGDAIVSSVQRKLRRYGLLNDSGSIKRGASLNAKQAEELRKFVGSELTGDTPNKRRMISSLVDALDDDVKTSAGEDVYEIARKVAKTRFEDLRIPAVRAIVDKDVRAEDIFDKFVRKGGIDDLTALKGYMSRGGEDAHQLTPAWNELRGETLKHVFAQGTKQAAKNELDDVVFSGPQFKKALDALGRRKLEVLFTPEELAKLDKVVKVAEWRVPMADVLNTSNTNSAWWNMVDRVLSYLPGKAGMVLRGAGRAAKVGADEIAQEVAARAAMRPGEELARQAEEAASERVSGAARAAVDAGRVPSFFAIGAERKRK